MEAGSQKSRVSNRSRGADGIASIRGNTGNYEIDVRLVVTDSGLKKVGKFCTMWRVVTLMMCCLFTCMIVCS